MTKPLAFSRLKKPAKEKSLQPSNQSRKRSRKCQKKVEVLVRNFGLKSRLFQRGFQKKKARFSFRRLGRSFLVS